MARPCPFYILDEVEAALDDINLDRFLRLVRRFAERSQFIVVTHQKRTMDAADILYGVSMGGDGITKVVSRKLPRDGELAARRRARGRRRGGRSGLTLSAPPMATSWRRGVRPRRRRGGPGRGREDQRRDVLAAARGALAQPPGADRRALGASFGDRVDEETWERLEEALILADVGAPTTAAVVRRLEDEVEAGKLSGGEAAARAADRAAGRDGLARRTTAASTCASAPR